MELGGGVGVQGVTQMLPDTLSDELLLAGSFTYANDVPVSPGILRWGMDGLTSVGCGVAWDCVTPLSQAGLGNPALSAVAWNGELYLGGAFFFTRDGTSYERIMRWDGIEWQAMPGIDGPIKSIKVIDGQLIVAGWFTYADTVLANGLARWDGDEWHRVVDVPQFYSGDINRVNDVEKFQGEWYLGGNMSEMHELAKYNGTNWEIVGGGFLGSFAQVNKLSTHDGRLYVAGSFNRCPEHAGVPSNPGSGIVAWDGAAWDDLGGGTCGASNGTVVSMTWWHDTLYACGNYDRIGGQAGDALAKWDGDQWCMLAPPGYWGNGGPNALAVFHDSLYIGGAFLVAGDDSVSCFGKWIGGDYTYSCGAITGTPDEEDEDGLFSIFPNPAMTSFTLRDRDPNIARIEVRDMLGRIVISTNMGSSLVDVDDLSAGTYVVTALSRDGTPLGTARLVKQ